MNNLKEVTGSLKVTYNMIILYNIFCFKTTFAADSYIFI